MAAGARDRYAQRRAFWALQLEAVEICRGQVVPLAR